MTDRPPLPPQFLDAPHNPHPRPHPRPQSVEAALVQERVGAHGGLRRGESESRAAVSRPAPVYFC